MGFSWDIDMKDPVWETVGGGEEEKSHLSSGEIKEICDKFVIMLAAAELRDLNKKIASKEITKEGIEKFFKEASWTWGYNEKADEYVDNAHFTDYDWDNILSKPNAAEIINGFRLLNIVDFSEVVLHADENGLYVVQSTLKDYADTIIEDDLCDKYTYKDILQSVRTGIFTDAVKEEYPFLKDEDEDKELEYEEPVEIPMEPAKPKMREWTTVEEVFKEMEELTKKLSEIVAQQKEEQEEVAQREPYPSEELFRDYISTDKPCWNGMSEDEIFKTCDEFVNMLAEEELHYVKKQVDSKIITKDRIKAFFNVNPNGETWTSETKSGTACFKDFDWDEILSRPNAAEIIEEYGFNRASCICSPELHANENGLYVTNSGNDDYWLSEALDRHDFTDEDIVQSVQTGEFTDAVKDTFPFFPKDFDKEKDIER
jgi:hypothetical protein